MSESHNFLSAFIRLPIRLPASPDLVGDSLGLDVVSALEVAPPARKGLRHGGWHRLFPERVGQPRGVSHVHHSDRERGGRAVLAHGTGDPPEVVIPGAIARPHEHAWRDRGEPVKRSGRLLTATRTNSYHAGGKAVLGTRAGRHVQIPRSHRCAVDADAVFQYVCT